VSTNWQDFQPISITKSSAQTASQLLWTCCLVINRRRMPRAAANSAAGMLRILDDVEIEVVTDQTITVLSDTQFPRGERMVLWAPAEDGGEVPVRVRAVQRQADMASASLRHRVKFDVDAIAASLDEPDRATRPATAASRQVGSIMREVPVKLVDLSGAGCLVESPVRITEGAVGWLSVNSRHGQHHEIVRVCRSDWRIERFWPCTAGIEFLTLEAPPSASLRRNVALFTTTDQESHDRT
jgi:hypothetical protein